MDEEDQNYLLCAIGVKVIIELNVKEMGLILTSVFRSTFRQRNRPAGKEKDDFEIVIDISMLNELISSMQSQNLESLSLLERSYQTYRCYTIRNVRTRLRRRL